MDTDELRKAKNKARKLESILSDLFDACHTVILGLRVILYVGSVLMAWFYLKDKVLAVGIVSSLTVAHLLIAAKEYVQKKKLEMKEDRDW
jgi:ethanolamine utilization microcompartment shell protein EutL